MQTNCGGFTIRLDRSRQSPNDDRVVRLARADDGFFDNTIFHRIVPGFVIQGGDPTATGTGGPGYTTVDKPPADAHYTFGVVAMAKTQTEPAGTARQPVLHRHRSRRRAAAGLRDARQGRRRHSTSSTGSASSATRPPSRPTEVVELEQRDRHAST